MGAIIAIDGPAASGKSSVARRLAEAIGFTYVNSGAFYRLVTWRLLERKINLDEASELRAAAGAADFRADLVDGKIILRIDGQDGGDFLNNDRVTGNVSAVAREPMVRDMVNRHLRSLASRGNAVVEGRDIGSVVFPDTPFKFYIDASPEVRQQRRSAQGQRDSVAQRDRVDSSRATAPLVITAGATVVDSTHLSIDDVVQEILARLQAGGLATARS